MKKILGLDLGISSCGWCLMLQNDDGQFERIEDIGVRTFTEIENGKTGKLENVDRRIKRGMRRQRRRKHLRREDAKKLFQQYLNVDFNKIEFNKYDNPYVLKVKGLSEKLSNEELSIALFHYIKYRGFKSNRKNEDAKSNGELLKRFDSISLALKENNITATEYLLEEYNKKDVNERRMHNTENTYLFNMTRDMYLDEIEKLLDNQLKNHTITEQFKEEYIKLFQRQRSFSEGPSKYSPYRGMDENGNALSLIEKMIGKCKFDGLTRAPKGAFSSEVFIYLSFLNNFSYKTSLDGQYNRLTKDEIEKLYKLALKKKTIKYKDIIKELNLDESAVTIKGLSLSKKQAIQVMIKYKKDNKLENQQLDAEQYEKYKLEVKKTLFEQKIKTLDNYLSQKAMFENYLKEHKNSKSVKEFIDNTNNFDDISVILLKYKTDLEITKACQEKGYDQDIIDIVLTLPSITKTIDLSLDICKKLNEKLLEGMTYDKAMEMIGYNHSNAYNIKEYKFLPAIDECMDLLNESLKNPVVRHSLVEFRKIINSVIQKYHKVDEIHIEFARELAKNFNDRREIRNNQLDNLDKNIKTKELLLLKYPNVFRSFKDITSEDILRYNLYIEQNHKCAYSNIPIKESELFNYNATQIDHIMPYSKTFENRSFNKVLVLTKYNQEKKDMLPYQAFSKEQFAKIYEFINDPYVKISDKKKETLLMKELDSRDEWIERNLNDTKYIARLSKKIVENILKIKTITINGAMTDSIKAAYGLKGITHSYIDKDYKKPREYKADINTIKASNKGLYFDVINQSTKQAISCSIEKIKPQKDKELSLSDSRINDMIEYFASYPEKLISTFYNGYASYSIIEIQNNLTNDLFNSIDINRNELCEKQLILLGIVQQIIDKDVLSKDRDNDLHHAVDAAIISVCDVSMIQRITKFYKIKEKHMDENGEIITHPKLDLPYKDFRNELIYRVYERDNNTLISKLSLLSNYENYDFSCNTQYVMYPSKSPITNVKGALFMETIFGVRNDKYIVKKVDVNKLKLSDKEPDKLSVTVYDEDGGNKAVLEAIVNWIKNGKGTKYPILPHKGTYIKKALVIESKDIKSRVRVSQDKLYKGFAGNDKVVRVDVYRSKDVNDDSIYMVPIYYYHLIKNNQNYTYTIMWSQGENNRKYISSNELESKYVLQTSLYRYSLIELTLRNDATSLCYSGGVTSGMYEVYSVVGDNWDIYKNGVMLRLAERNIVTISNIKKITLKNISVLGKIK